MKSKLIAILILILAAVVILSVARQKDKEEEAVFCTMDAMQCPDGSYVGREGPNCEFRKCPGN